MEDRRNRDVSENDISDDLEMGVLVNFHLKEYQTVSVL